MAEKEVKDEYALVEVPTQMGLAIRTPQGEVLSTELALVEILNQLRKLDKI